MARVRPRRRGKDGTDKSNDTSVATLGSNHWRRQACTTFLWMCSVTTILVYFTAHLYKKSIESTPSQRFDMNSETKALFRRAGSLAHRGNTGRAAIAYLEALDAAAEHNFYVPPAMHLDAASTFAANRDFDEAESQYKLALQEDQAGTTDFPTSHAVSVFVGRALLAAEQGHHYRAIDMWKQSLQLEPQNPELLTALGKAYATVTDSRNAEIAFIGAVEADSSLPVPRYLLAVSAVEKGDVEAAERHVDAAIATDASSEDFHALAMDAKDRYPVIAERFFRAALGSVKSNTHARAMVHGYGTLLANLERYEDEASLYENAVALNVLNNSKQRPLILLPELLPATPWPSAELLSLDSIRLAVELLEKEAKIVRDEWAAVARNVFWFSKFDEVNDTSKTFVKGRGSWRQKLLMQDGSWIPTTADSFPDTQSLVQRVQEVAASGDTGLLPKGTVGFSTLAPKTELRRHCGPTNHRLRLHLGIQIPNGATIDVSGELKHWERDKVLIVDDSFEHSVINSGADDRVILVIDVWHPSLDAEGREQTRSLFGDLDPAATKEWH